MATNRLLIEDAPVTTESCVTVGADEKSGVRIVGATTVAREHASVHVDADDGKAFIVDLASAHGTYVNNVRIAPLTRVKLEPSDYVSLGSPEFLDNRTVTPLLFRVVERATNDPLKPPKTPVEVPDGLAKHICASFQCCICCDLLLNPFSMQCGHTFCGDCLATWYMTTSSGNKTCPQCRTVLDNDTPFPCIQLRDFIDETLAPTLKEDAIKEREWRLQVWHNRRELMNHRATRPKRGGGISKRGRGTGSPYH
jgi:pSer/pThr/pTyr-binding forkhead associated (FHA) protein